VGESIRVAKSPEITDADSISNVDADDEAPLEQQLARHNNWRREMIKLVTDYEKWLSTNDRLNDDNHQTLQQTLRSLNNDRITIALVGEYSRGKTELINAIFFADYNDRNSLQRRRATIPASASYRNASNQPAHVRTQ